MRRVGNIAPLSLCLLVVTLGTWACDGGRPEPPRLSPTRGLILISLDTLRADRLGAYGYERPTSPFFDRLAAERGALFEHVSAPYPATLVSHMSMFTGLYPPQHGVYPPAMVLSDTVWTAAAALREAGFRTEAHTEGGYVARGYGFERGFEVYDDSAYGGDADIETTLARGLDFLAGLADDEPFYLFLHSYSVHDPYDPPRFVEELDGAEPAPESGGERLRDFNLGRTEIPPAEVERLSRRYDASVRYVDSVLEDFVGRLETLGLLEETVLVITSDHGEEFLEHGKLAHTQLYPEVLGVPLLIVHPDLDRPRRIEDQVSLVDLAPTVVELVGQAPPEGLAGRSLVSYLTDQRAAAPRRVYAEVDDTRFVRSLVGEVDGTRYQLLVEGAKPDVEGVWVARQAELDVFGSRLEFRGRSYHEARRVTVEVEGSEVAELELTPQWDEVAVELGTAELQRVTLTADGCVSPREVGESRDGRCLGFIVQGPPLMAAELFDLDSDPYAQVDVSRERPLVTRRMLRELQDASLTAVGGATTRELSEKDRQRLRDLGYLD